MDAPRKGQVAIVTGGACGIGLGIAFTLAQAGAVNVDGGFTFHEEQVHFH